MKHQCKMTSLVKNVNWCNFTWKDAIKTYAKELTVKVMFWGEQRWRPMVHEQPLFASAKVVFNAKPKDGGLCWYLMRVDDKDSTVILKAVLCKYKYRLKKWLLKLIPWGNYICWDWYNRNWKTLRDIDNDHIKSCLGTHNNTVPMAPSFLVLYGSKSNIVTFRFT
jgi:hypothetical protein